MSDFLHLVGGALRDPVDAAFPPVAFKYGDPLDSLPRRAFTPLGTAQFQRRAGTCLPHAYAACVEAAVLPSDLQVSIMDWYFGGRWLEHNGAEERDGGTYPSKGREWASRHGLVTAARAPYDDSAVKTWRPKAEWAADRALLACRFEPIPLTAEAILTEIANGGTVPVCHKVVDSIFDTSRVDGTERFIDGANLGGHCRLAMGYDLDESIDGERGVAYVWNWWEGFGVRHPSQGHIHDSVSRMRLSHLVHPAFLQNADRLATPPEVMP